MSFPLIGNERLREATERLIRADRLPHAVLINGEPGCGRHTLALHLARAAICLGTDRPCGECRHCKMALDRSHPDITTVSPEDGKRNISVDQIRKLRQEAFVRPHMADRRVFLVDPADSMNPQAQNALLKILEEPPAGVMFLLIAENEATLLDTVISRCVPLSPTVPNTAEALEYLMCQPKVTDREAAADALRAAGNNIGRALAFLTGKEKAAEAVAAQDFVRFLLRLQFHDALRVLTPFEKDRSSAALLFEKIRTELAREIRSNHGSPRVGMLTELYEQFGRDEQLLRTNINLPLLFTAAVCRADQLLN